MQAFQVQFARTALALLLAGTLVLPALAHSVGAQQRRKGSPSQERANRESRTRPGPEKKQQLETRKMMGLPPHWMERLQDMTPGAQERFLANNEHFKNLPPDRQAQIRRRLQHWNSLAPEQRQALRERELVWERMTPDQKRYVREELLPKWQRLPADRRQILVQKLHALRNLNDSERGARLNDPAFVNGLSPDERVMLRDLSNLRVGAAPEPPQDNP